MDDYGKALEKLKKTEQDSAEWWKAIVERDREAYRLNRKTLVGKIREAHKEKDKAMSNIRSYLQENLEELREMVDNGIDHKHLIAKIDSILNNVLYDEF